ncbi:MAG: APC family permease [Blastocatellia bacterium]
MSNTTNHRTLHRALGTFAAAAFVVTNMVGTGIFTVPAFVRTQTGNGLAALAVWAVGALLALCGALCYAELATRMPEAGGEYFYLTRIYGRLWGFLSGWISFVVGFSAAIAASSLGAAAYATEVFPALDAQAPLLTIAGWSLTRGAAFAALLITALSVFHCTGVRVSGKFQTAIALSVIAAVVAMTIGGIATGRGDWNGITQGSRATGTWWVALIMVSFAYSGWNAAAYLAGEVVNPRRTLPRALIGGTMTVGVLYLALNLLFLYAVPAGEWESKVSIGSVAAEKLFGASGARTISAVITLIIIGSVSSMVAAGPRVYYAMSRDGLAHTVFGTLQKTTGAPVVAILSQALVAIMLALTGAFDTLLTYAGAALSLFTALAVGSLYLIPRPTADEASRLFRTPGYPVTPAIYLLMVAITFIQGLRERPGPTGAALLTILAGVGLYFIARAGGWLKETAEHVERAEHAES